MSHNKDDQSSIINHQSSIILPIFLIPIFNDKLSIINNSSDSND